MYKVTEELKNAIVKAAFAKGSYRKLGQECKLSGISLSLVTDGHIKELDKAAMQDLLPLIAGYMSPAERRDIMEFIQA